MQMERPDQIRPEAPPAEAAPGIARIDVDAVASKTARVGHASRQKIYPKLAHGHFRAVKWYVMVRHARHLLRAAVDQVGPRPSLPDRPSCSISPMPGCSSAPSRSGLRSFISSPAS